MRHRNLLLREWALLAAVPPSSFEPLLFTGYMLDEDARRLVATSEQILQRIGDVSAGRIHPLPEWAKNHRPYDGPLTAHSAPIPPPSSASS